MSLKISSMQRYVTKLAVLAALALGVQMSHGFALKGPFENYQVNVIGYRWDSYFNGIPGGVVGYSDDGGPHNIGEEFRRNTPVMYYAFDANFLEFFGSNGVAAVDQAYMVMNSLTNISEYSGDLSEFPLTSQRINYQAQNLFMTDLKSMTMHLMMNQLGLDSPDRYTWTLHDRNTTPVPCPLGNSYLVVMRNFEVMSSSLQQPQYSAYVNGTLYTYGIVEFCTPALAYTVPYTVDPLADTWTAVASQAAWIGTGPNILYDGHNAGGVGLHVGGFYTYLTRDDVGGLRYLLQTNNYNLETSGPDTIQFVTNSTTPLLLTNMFNLGLFAAQAATNNAAAMQALYPGLVINSTTELPPTLGWVTNISLVVTSSPFLPAGTIAIVAVATRDPVPIFHFIHDFGNIITNTYSSTTTYRTQIISPGTAPFSPVGSPITLTTNTSKLITVNVPSGSFYLLPTNLCAIKVIGNIFTNVVSTTNLVATVTFGVGGTNQTATLSTITTFTNNWLVYLPVTCPADTVALRQGIERVQFVRRDFDSLIGTFWTPVTNNYTMVELTKNSLHPQQIRRVVNQPDFLFTADDLAEGPTSGGFPIVDTVLTSFPHYSQVASNGLAGPGTIQSPTTFTFNKVGVISENFYDFALGGSSFAFISDQSSAIRGLVWASYDGTTNDPVIYPNGTSLDNLVNQFIIRVQPTKLGAGTNGVPYTFVYTNTVSSVVYTNTFSVTGGNAPYTWSLAPASAGLPTGLTLTSAGQISGAPAGLPLNVPFDFTVRMTDALTRFVDTPLSITILR